MQEPHGFPIKTFATNQRFVKVSERQRASPDTRRSVHLEGVRSSGKPSDSHYSYTYAVPADQSERDDIIAILQQLYDKKIGELGSYWARGSDEMFDVKYAKVKLGDLFDFYTTSDGELKFPPWDSFKFVVDEYLEAEAARTKYHPSRVQQFIDTNGLEQLELME